jgi:hypothetical protein
MTARNRIAALGTRQIGTRLGDCPPYREPELEMVLLTLGNYRIFRPLAGTCQGRHAYSINDVRWLNLLVGARRLSRSRRPLSVPGVTYIRTDEALRKVLTTFVDRRHWAPKGR